jgi:pimeloyl-ACP methyl ester carboxylesterase
MTTTVTKNAAVRLDVGEISVGYREAGAGPAVLLLHGCPFASFVWRDVMASLTHRFYCLAPDLLGLGDTETPDGADWSLVAQAHMVIGFLDSLGIDRAHVVAHDHGGAVAQLLAARHPERIDRLVLSNVEAYDNWPSAEERPFVLATQAPILGDIVLRAFARPRILRFALTRAHAVYDRRRLSRVFVQETIAANLADARRRAKTKRFLAGQLDPDHNRVTLDLVDGLRQFDHPTLLLWAVNDAHFGPVWAERLRSDLPGPVEVRLLDDTGHLLMEERPGAYAALVGEFLSAA